MEEDDSMASQNTPPGSLSHLDGRVTGLETSFRGLERNFNAFAAETKGDFNSLRADLTVAIDKIGTKVSEQSRPQYALMISIGGFALAVLVALGSALWSPVNESLHRLENKAERLSTEKVDVDDGKLWDRLREEQRGRLQDQVDYLKERVKNLEKGHAGT